MDRLTTKEIESLSAASKATDRVASLGETFYCFLNVFDCDVDATIKNNRIT